MSVATSRALRNGCGVLLCLCTLSCGGGGGGGGGGSNNNMPGPSNTPVPPASNVASVTVDGGPSGAEENILYTTLTICAPGSTTNCQTIKDIQVDTGSSGLRLLAPILTLTLPVAAAPDGSSLLECYGYVDGYTWGPVALVDVQISGESAHSVPVELIGDSRFLTVPAACSSIGPPENTVAEFGANGILGIGFQPQDCGSICVTNAIAQAYYSCTATACHPTMLPLASQVPNPVTMFATDKNGTIISLPSVAATGAASVTGSLIFGIDTQSNNASAGSTVLVVDANQSNLTYGDFTTVFNGQTLRESFIDSGSNGDYFNDSILSQSLCPKPNQQFYCPMGTPGYNATLQGFNGGPSTTINFTVSRVDTLPADVRAFPGLAGPTSINNSFDWGLPFFYGRRVITAIQGGTTSAGMGPYVAFQ